LGGLFTGLKFLTANQKFGIYKLTNRRARFVICLHYFNGFFWRQNRELQGIIENRNPNTLEIMTFQQHEK
jgi:hypothetical protein